VASESEAISCPYRGCAGSVQLGGSGFWRTGNCELCGRGVAATRTLRCKRQRGRVNARRSTRRFWTIDAVLDDEPVLLQFESERDLCVRSGDEFRLVKISGLIREGPRFVNLTRGDAWRIFGGVAPPRLPREVVLAGAATES
jgi:hypothetical protein